jgi:purine-binding chemotaxis protein CheW
LALQELASTRYLIVRAADRLCGLPLASVVEIMRPLPLQELAGLPAYLCGLAVVRGEPTPVVDVSTVLTGVSNTKIGRFLSMRSAGRPFVLGVEAVVGLKTVERSTLRAVPELLDPARDLVESVGTVGTELLTIFRSSGAFAEELWAGVDRAQRAAGT